MISRMIVPIALACVAACLAPTLDCAAERKLDLDVLYLGVPSSPRTPDFEAFLRQHFARVTVMDREAFKVAELDPGVDVVLLDWHQGEGDFPPSRSYLGAWGELKTPAVLLGSAGLLHAVADELLGGFG